tara:strand:- start:2775 stop:3281 length:507 start_codon:yes stop_codon:yes gene_type:complete
MVQKALKQKSTKKKKQPTRYSEKKYLAIDPGKSGGVAIIDDDNVIAYKCPATYKEMAQLIRTIKNDSYVDRYSFVCILERVHAFPTDARSSAFKFGTNYGVWMGILESNNIDYELITPRKWQHDFSLPKIKKERKQELKKIAKCFYEKATLYTADAICMAVWARANGQ